MTKPRNGTFSLARSLTLLLTLALSSVAQAASKIYYVHTDHLGTPQVLTDQNQSVVWKGEYTPFGEVKEVVNALGQNVRFPGQYHDRETGYYYNYYRDYDPSLGRYIQSDPIGLRGGVNTYGYVYQNPLRYSDPSGESATLAWCFGGPFACAAGVATAVYFAYWATHLPAQINNQNNNDDYTGAGGACPTDRLSSLSTNTPDPCDMFPGFCDEEPPVTYTSPRNLNPTQSRNEMSGSQINKMAKDMKENGYDIDKYGPIQVSRVPGSNRLEIFDGHHRAAAAVKAGINNVPVQIW